MLCNFVGRGDSFSKKMHTDKKKMKKEVENRLAEVMWRSKKREKGRQTRSKEQQRAHVREERGPMMKSQHSRAIVAP